MVVVVTDRPQDLLSVTKKQWHLLIRLVQRERSSTLKLARIAELSNQMSWMQHLQFTTKLSDDIPSSIVFAPANELIKEPPICATLYIAQRISTEQFHLITSWMPKGSVVVVYG